MEHDEPFLVPKPPAPPPGNGLRRRLLVTAGCLALVALGYALGRVAPPAVHAQAVASTPVPARYTLCRPDPRLLVWDEDAVALVHAAGGLPVYLKGWLNVPLVHEKTLLAPLLLASPQVAVRVAAYTDCAPKALSPLLTHCGGPGSGNDCLTIPQLLPDLNASLDNLAISQRGVLPPRWDRRPPTVPFKNADGSRVYAYPNITCYQPWATPIVDHVRAAYAHGRIDQRPLDALLSAYSQPGGEMLLVYNSTLVKPYSHLLAAAAAECRTRPEYRTLGGLALLPAPSPQPSAPPNSRPSSTPSPQPSSPSNAQPSSAHFPEPPSQTAKSQPSSNLHSSSSSPPSPGGYFPTPPKRDGVNPLNPLNPQLTIPSVFDSDLAGRMTMLDTASTTDLARDLNVLRIAIGAPTLSIWGTSYGTVVGGTYAAMFSQHLDALVLDGNVGIDDDIYRYGETLAKSYDDVWNGMTAACDATYFSASELWGDKADESREHGRDKMSLCAAAPYATEKFQTLMKRTQSAAQVLQLLKNALDFGVTETGIAPHGAIAMACIESLHARGDLNGPGCCAAVVEKMQMPAPEREWADKMAIIQTVRSLDVAGRVNPLQLSLFYAELGVRHPLGVQGATNIIYIASSPIVPRPTPPFGSTTVAPLIIGTLNDPATSFAAAQDMSSFFPQGKLLTWQGFLHGFRIVNSMPDPRDSALELANGGWGAYVCTQYLKKYLLTRALPRDGTACPINGPGASALALEVAVANAGRGLGQTCL